MTKTLNHIIIFFGNQNIFLEKKHTPPPFKLNGRSLNKSISTLTLYSYVAKVFHVYNGTLSYAVEVYDV